MYLINSCGNLSRKSLEKLLWKLEAYSYFHTVIHPELCLTCTSCLPPLTAWISYFSTPKVSHIAFYRQCQEASFPICAYDSTVSIATIPCSQTTMLALYLSWQPVWKDDTPDVNLCIHCKIPFVSNAQYETQITWDLFSFEQQFNFTSIQFHQGNQKKGQHMKTNRSLELIDIQSAMTVNSSNWVKCISFTV